MTDGHGPGKAAGADARVVEVVPAAEADYRGRLDAGGIEHAGGPGFEEGRVRFEAPLDAVRGQSAERLDRGRAGLLERRGEVHDVFATGLEDAGIVPRGQRPEVAEGQDGVRRVELPAGLDLELSGRAGLGRVRRASGRVLERPGGHQPGGGRGGCHSEGGRLAGAASGAGGCQGDASGRGQERDTVREVPRARAPPLCGAV